MDSAAWENRCEVLPSPWCCEEEGVTDPTARETEKGRLFIMVQSVFLSERTGRRLSSLRSGGLERVKHGQLCWVWLALLSDDSYREAGERKRTESTH